ncbi:hypothetical protein NC653_000653 [Populus alba x Populus x berolinensis]|uniref:Uncharacterized protein n=1 Tax=Populus alba x Populus x berolinensis TaxID=444605 RepID=A0AAD6RJ86_9ROSI|nr:hypothetical protein NC653_000653 [Populus alba x Populus x berolinensis]
MEQWPHLADLLLKMWKARALATLILNKLRAGIKVCTIKAPGFGGRTGKAILQVLAALTGGESYNKKSLASIFENVDLDMLGSCKKVSKDDTVILDGAGDKKSIERERCEQIRSCKWIQALLDYDKEKLQERIGEAFCCKLGSLMKILLILQIWRSCDEAEVSAKKARVTDCPKCHKGCCRKRVVVAALLYVIKRAWISFSTCKLCPEDLCSNYPECPEDTSEKQLSFSRKENAISLDSATANSLPGTMKLKDTLMS